MMYNKKASFRVFGYAEWPAIGTVKQILVNLFDRKYLSMFPGGGGRKTKLRIKNPPHAERSPSPSRCLERGILLSFSIRLADLETLRE